MRKEKVSKVGSADKSESSESANGGSVAAESSLNNQNRSRGIEFCSESNKLDLPPTTINSSSKTFNKVLEDVPTYAEAVKVSPNRSKGASKQAVDNRCGLAGFSPKWLQKLANPIPFLVVVSLLALVQSLVTGGYTSGVLTTIEKRYNLQSWQLGFIVSAYDFSAIFSGVLVSYFGDRYNRASWLGRGTLVFALGNFLFVLPFLTDDDYKPEISFIREPDICTVYANDTKQCSSSLSTDSRAFCYFILAQMVVGLGTGPIFTLAPTYLYDNVAPARYAFLSSIFFSMTALGPAIGFLLSALIIGTTYIEPGNQPLISALSDVLLPDFSKTISLSQTLAPWHAEWVGAWWLGYLGCSLVSILIAIPLFFFPQKLPGRSAYKKEPALALYSPELMSCIGMSKIICTGQSENIKNGHSRSRSLGNVVSICQQQHVRSKSVGSAVEHRSQLKTRSPFSSFWGLNVIKDKLCSINLQSTLKASNQENSEKICNSKLNITFSKFIDEVKPEKSKESGASLLTIAPISLQQQMKDLPTSLKSLLRNRNWLTMTGMLVMELSISCGFTRFNAKYLEEVFSVNSSKANILTGLVMIPGACIGFVLGGYLMKKLQLSLKGTYNFLFFLNILPTLGIAILLILSGCDAPKHVGFNTHYPDSSPSSFQSQGLDSTCNQFCNCSYRLEPVCSDSLNFYSACHAGCRNYTRYREINGEYKTNFTDCTCAPSGVAKEGRCVESCRKLTFFLIILFLIVLITCCGHNPILLITLKTVEPDVRSFALGLQNFFIQLLAFIPSPIYFGHVFDTQCLVWSSNCQAGDGPCAQYRTHKLPYILLGIYLSFKVVCYAFLITGRICNGRTLTQPQEVSSPNESSAFTGTTNLCSLHSLRDRQGQV